ncbi:MULTISPECIES: GDSL-type esterase/lipase family protein [Pacificibacter]|uniref:GDSL-type esterase/lipase family protein n=1 Tax=Pacificibacter TaxID=1042323 RepID=UPI001C0A66E0|nr:MULTISPECIES: GDSL-type esterase/lipase family protein [Pacificibacter]MBU2937418.1 hydrolase [Pacificibacter marinus]MDO6617060.1 GDSL-type esterase/lipase family protein [Pacificibacter sp. 1_MG-2023]
MTSAPVILCFGDSNTHGTCPMQGIRDVRRFPLHERWPGVAQAVLGDSAQLIEAGHPGRTTLFDNRTAGGNRSGLTALNVYLESNCPLDCVVLMLGTNDLHAHYAISAQVVAWNLAQLIELIQQTPCGPVKGQAPKILIVAPPHIVETGFAASAMAGAAEKSQQLGACLRELADQYGTGFIDAATIVSADPLDGIHLSADAHIQLGHAIAEHITTLLEV